MGVEAIEYMLEEELADLGVLALVSLTKEMPQASENH
jgi:hypothetical protein